MLRVFIEGLEYQGIHTPQKVVEGVRSHTSTLSKVMEYTNYSLNIIVDF